MNWRFEELDFIVQADEHVVWIDEEEFYSIVGSQYPFLEVSSDDEDEAEEQYKAQMKMEKARNRFYGRMMRAFWAEVPVALGLKPLGSFRSFNAETVPVYCHNEY